MFRILLFLATNLAVVLSLALAGHWLGVDAFLRQNGLRYEALLAFAALTGFGGAFISLLLSKPLAKWTLGLRVVRPSDTREQWLLATVERLAAQAGIAMPEVAIYDGAPNAFATGAFRNHALVAISSELPKVLAPYEIEAVLAHEIAHIANGDMVTLSLVQGVLNTFTVFLARVVGYAVDRAVWRNEEGVGAGYYLTVFALDLLLGVLASLVVAAVSRQREYRADEGAARLMGDATPMIHALQSLNRVEAGGLPKSLAAFGVTGSGRLANLFGTHPSLDARVARLAQLSVS